MQKDLQFSAGFLSLRGDSDLERLDGRLLADAGITRSGRGAFERDGVAVDAPESRPQPAEWLMGLARVWRSLSLRHA